jgi:uncharacterized membrane protein SpoIIM required for sporulation
MKSSILKHLLIILTFASLSFGMAIALNSTSTTSASSLNSSLLENLSHAAASSVDLAKGWCYSQQCWQQRLTKADKLEIVAIVLGIVLGIPLIAFSFFCQCLCCG